MAKGTVENRAASVGKEVGIVNMPLWAGHLLAILTLLAVGLVCYADTFTVPFVLDDVTSILTNPLVKSFDFRLQSRILGDLSFALNYRLHGFGLTGYHAVNLILHLINAAFVYLLVQLIFRTPVLRDSAVDNHGSCFSVPQVIGFMAAMLFVSHPLQTQAVTYLAQRVAVLAACCYLGAILSYAASRLSRNRTAAALMQVFSLLLAVAGVLTKENAVTIPLAILLFELTFFRGSLRERLPSLVWYLLPLFIAPLAMLGRIGFSADLLGEVSRLTAESGAPSRGSYLLTQFPVIVSYLRLFLLPVGQNLDHDISLRTSLADPVVLGALFLLTFLALFGCRYWFQARRMSRLHGVNSLLGYGVGWFFTALLVESSFIPIRDVMFEHRLYLPSVGLTLIVSAAIWRIANWWRNCHKRQVVAVCLLFSATTGLLFGTATYLRNRVWQSEVTLWQDVVKKSPAKSRAQGSLGHALQRAGNLDAAVHSYLLAVQLAPGDHIARNNLGTVYLAQDRPKEALEQFRQALSSTPSFSVTHYNMGLAYAKMERFEEAAASYRESIRSGGENDQVQNNLGITLFRLGRPREALALFRGAVRRNPGNVEAAANLATIEKSLSVSTER